jgi:Ice-binding-like
MLGAITAPRVAGLVVIVAFAALAAAACEDALRATPPPAGQLSTITVTPNPVTLGPGSSQQFVAAGTDNNGTPIVVVPTWAVVANGGTINSGTGMFDAGMTLGSYPSTIRACDSEGINCGFANVTVANTPTAGPSLGSASTYGITAGSTVSCVTGGTIDADVAVQPGTALVGFPTCVITGQTHLADSTALAAQTDLTAAYNALVAMSCGTTVTPSDLGGRTLAPGVYCVSTSMAVTGTVTLDGQGNSNALFVFQMGSTLTTSTTANIALINGAQAKNVFWQVGTTATLNTGTMFRGNILAYTTITLNDNATMLGRALARNGAVSLGTNNTITLP